MGVRGLVGAALVIGIVSGCAAKARPPVLGSARAGANKSTSWSDEIAATVVAPTCFGDRARVLEIHFALPNGRTEWRTITCRGELVHVTAWSVGPPTEEPNDKGPDVSQSVTSVTAFDALFAEASRHAHACPRLSEKAQPQRDLPRDAVVMRVAGLRGPAIVCDLATDPEWQLWLAHVSDGTKGPTPVETVWPAQGENWRDEIGYRRR